MRDGFYHDPFNLLNAAWLPVRRRSGAIERIPPWQITNGMANDPFVAFAWPRPDFDGAAHEFLIGLLSTAAAPEDDDAWEDWWFSPPMPDDLRQRFASIDHAFCLDGPGPRFLQDLDSLAGAEEKEIAALLIDAPGAQTLRNNADLFVKRGGVPVMCRAAAAMALFTLSAYAPAGGAGHRTSLRGGGPLTTLIVAQRADGRSTLWDRLWPNVETEEQVARRSEQVPRRDDHETIFPWLVPTRTSNRKARGMVTTPQDVHPLQVYWGMPRRIRLLYEEGGGRLCGLTGEHDDVVVRSFRTRNYGTDYSEGFTHPLSPYYRQNAKQTIRLPVHPRPGGISYRHWPGLVLPSGDGLRDPAQVVRHWPERRREEIPTRMIAFGYDMDNMKARAWVESEMPLWLLRDESARDLLGRFVALATEGAGTVARLLTRAVKSALYERPGDAPGDFGFIAERFYRETEAAFHGALGEAANSIESEPHADDPSIPARETWLPVMARAALRLFDEYAPSDGLEDRAMHRHVRARFLFTLALAGRGAAGRSLFKDLGIPFPAPARTHQGDRAA